MRERNNQQAVHPLSGHRKNSFQPSIVEAPQHDEMQAFDFTCYEIEHILQDDHNQHIRTISKAAVREGFT